MSVTTVQNHLNTTNEDFQKMEDSLNTNVSNLLQPENIPKKTNTMEDNPIILEDSPPIVEYNGIPKKAGAEKINEVLTTAKKVVFKKTTAAKKVTTTKEDAKRDRTTITANFTAAEYEPIKKIMEYRQKEGMCTTADHFVRQCIDFAMCHGFVLKDFLQNIPPENVGLFALPDGIQIKPLEKRGFFNK